MEMYGEIVDGYWMLPGPVFRQQRVKTSIDNELKKHLDIIYSYIFSNI